MHLILYFLTTFYYFIFFGLIKSINFILFVGFLFLFIWFVFFDAIVSLFSKWLNKFNVQLLYTLTLDLWSSGHFMHTAVTILLRDSFGKYSKNVPSSKTSRDSEDDEERPATAASPA